jgi:serine/threonine protein kinase
MASVWLADDAELGRRVAVKLLGPDADRARFEREARAAAALAHPNICQLYDYGEDEGRPYMVLEHLAGGSLDDRIRRGEPLPDAETARIAREIAQGLAHAHERGLVHRDLKPANILFDSEGRAKIADFGIARMGGAGTLTAAGTVLGTAAYISPEQARGETATPASDVYSFGVMLFLMLTGRLPFEAAGAMQLAAMHRDEPPPPVSSFRPDAPQQLASVADASLAKDPRSRPPNGAALAAELEGEAFAGAALPLTGEPTQVIPRARPARPVRSRRLLPLALAGAALLLAAGVGLAFLATDSGSPTRSGTLPDISAPPTRETSTAATTTEPTTRPTTTAPTTTAPTTATATTRPTTGPTTGSTTEPTTAPTTVPTTTPTTVPTETTVPTDTLPTTTADTTTADTTTVPVP